uniref:N-acetyltransferase 8-like 2 n=1 Tax=Maylandia zebra TaxID=106582 RepID=A0A3P9B5N4_9CICH
MYRHCVTGFLLVIRRYRPADKDTVLTLFSTGILEHIRPCFYNAMTSPLYLTITPTLCAVGYLLGSVFGAVLFPAAWVGLIYYCCHEVYASFVRVRLRNDMQDIPGNFLSRPDDCFWVAEAEVGARAQVVGLRSSGQRSPMLFPGSAGATRLAWESLHLVLRLPRGPPLPSPSTSSRALL